MEQQTISLKGKSYFSSLRSCAKDDYLEIKFFDRNQVDDKIDGGFLCLHPGFVC